MASIASFAFTPGTRTDVGLYLAIASTNRSTIPLPPSDTTAPSVGAFLPAAGSTIAPDDPISFQVSDDSNDLRRIIVTATYPHGVVEVVHNGSTFSPNYTGAVEPFSGGYDYTIRRVGGWPAIGPTRGITIDVYAIDPSGNEAT